MSQKGESMEKINMTKIINYFTYKYHGDWDSIYYAIQNKEKINIDEIENFSKTNKNIPYVSIIDEHYPNNFKSIYMPPLTIYFAGNWEISKNENILSLWGEFNENDFKKLCLTNRIFAFKYNENNLSIAKKYANNDIKIILVDYCKFNEQIANNINDNILYISEIPINSTNPYHQKMDRLLIGISNKSVFLNDNDVEFNNYLSIHQFEKRKMLIDGKYKQKYLSYAHPYKIIN